MGLFGLDHARKHDEKVELLETIYDPVREALLCGLLREESIPYLRQERGSGDAMRILAGNSLYGVDILVANRDLIRARELLLSLAETEEVSEEGENVSRDDTVQES